MTLLLDLLNRCSAHPRQCRLHSVLVLVRVVLEVVVAPCYDTLHADHKAALQRAFDAARAALQARLRTVDLARYKPAVPADKRTAPDAAQPPLFTPKAADAQATDRAATFAAATAPAAAATPAAAAAPGPAPGQRPLNSERESHEVLVGLVDQERSKFLSALNLKTNALISDSTCLVACEALGRTRVPGPACPAWLKNLELWKRCPLTEQEDLQVHLHMLQLIEHLVLTLKGRTDSVFNALASPKPPRVGSELDTRDRAGVNLRCRVMSRSPGGSFPMDLAGNIDTQVPRVLRCGGGLCDGGGAWAAGLRCSAGRGCGLAVCLRCRSSAGLQCKGLEDTSMI